jgi:hypothetical protein
MKLKPVRTPCSTAAVAVSSPKLCSALGSRYVPTMRYSGKPKGTAVLRIRAGPHAETACRRFAERFFPPMLRRPISKKPPRRELELLVDRRAFVVPQDVLDLQAAAIVDRRRSDSSTDTTTSLREGSRG